MKYCFKANNHALTCTVVPVNGFGSAYYMDIALYIALASYSGLQDGTGASYCYSTGVVGIFRYIMAASCIFTLLSAIFLIKTDK